MQTGFHTFYGPFSAFSTGLLQPSKLTNRPLSQPTSFESTSTIPKIVFVECIALFFRWQHPYCTLLDRDAFLLDFHSAPRFGEHCTPLLLYTVCALGSSMSHDGNIKGLASLFFGSAEQELQNGVHWKTTLTTSQAMLLCAVYELGRGNYSKAWSFSGWNRSTLSLIDPVLTASRHVISNGREPWSTYRGFTL